MKNKIKNLLSTCLFILVYSPNAYSQGYDAPLTMQGLNHTTNPSVISRGMGGVMLSLNNDASAMFANPAGMQSLEGIQISIGGLQKYRQLDQTQQWYVYQNYSMFPLLMAGLTRELPDPDSAHMAATAGIRILTAQDTVPRPYDDISPDWQYKKNESIPLQAFVAVPFSVGGFKFAGGIGAAEYALANYYFQNNNVLAPDFGSPRDTLIYRPSSTDIQFAEPVYWSQHIRTRVGSIYGYGGALSMEVNQKLSFGVSAMFLDGTSNDYEWIRSRGVLYFYTNYMGLYQYQYSVTSKGNSKYKGSEFIISGRYKQRNFTLNIAIKPPMTITRDYSSVVEVDTFGTLMSSENINGTDKIKLPIRGALGIGITLRENLSIGVEYEYLPYSTSEYISSSNASSEPWLDSYSFKIGFEYSANSWLSLRAGYNKLAEIFETKGNYTEGTPISSAVYSCGIGLTYKSIQLNIAYEYQKIQYEDKWLTNFNTNKDTYQTISASISYTYR
jgi:long-subunit fatty acid transport protein